MSNQFFNAVYVLNGDASNPTDVYIYDATAKSWTTQTVKAADVSSFDLTSLKAILDHDTNVFCKQTLNLSLLMPLSDEKQSV